MTSNSSSTPSWAILVSSSNIQDNDMKMTLMTMMMNRIIFQYMISKECKVHIEILQYEAELSKGPYDIIKWISYIDYIDNWILSSITPPTPSIIERYYRTNEYESTTTPIRYKTFNWK